MISTQVIITLALAAVAIVALVMSLILWRSRRRVLRRVSRLNEELLEASRDASVGHRLSIPNDPEAAGEPGGMQPTGATDDFELNRPDDHRFPEKWRSAATCWISSMAA